MKIENKMGRVYGTVTVLKQSEKRGNRGRVMWDGVCECGKTVSLPADKLVDTLKYCSKKCGARSKLAREIAVHVSKHPLYTRWKQLRGRCMFSCHERYKDYGARGVFVSKEWGTFSQFRDDMAPTYRSGMSLERVDNNGPYSKENCVWANAKTQGVNKRNNVVLDTAHGKMTVSQAARFFNLPYHVVYARKVLLGWPDEQTVAPILKSHTALKQWLKNKS